MADEEIDQYKQLWLARELPKSLHNVLELSEQQKSMFGLMPRTDSVNSIQENARPFLEKINRQTWQAIKAPVAPKAEPLIGLHRLCLLDRKPHQQKIRLRRVLIMHLRNAHLRLFTHLAFCIE